MALLPLRGASIYAFPKLKFGNIRQLRRVGSVADVTQDGLGKRERWRLRATVPRTHVLTFPMYQNAELWNRMAELRAELIDSHPGTLLERKIIIPWINEALEFKLGNIIIKDSKSHEESNDVKGSGFPSFEHHQVMDVLQGLKNPIRQLIVEHGYNDGVLRVPFGRVRPISTEGKYFDPERVHLLLLEPEESKEAETLRAISRLVFDTFKSAGMFIAPPVIAPLLATTLINTKNRALHQNLPAAQRPRTQKRRPFDLGALYACEAFKAFQHGSRDSPPPSDMQQHVSLDLGTADFTHVCLRRVAMPVESRELIHDGLIDILE